MDFELKNSQISLFLMAIVLILVGFVLFSEAALWQTETTTVQTNSENIYQSDTKEIMAVYQTNYSVDWGPNVENDYGSEDDFAQSWYGIIGSNSEEGCKYSNDVCYAMGAYAELMGNLASILYLIVLLGIGFLFFSSTPNAFESTDSASLTKKIGISIALISILMAVYFMLESVNIREDLAEEYGGCEYLVGPCVELEGFWGSDTWEGDTNDGSQNFDTSMNAKWGPGLAWYLMALVIPLLSLVAVYFSSDENEESNIVYIIPLVLFFFALFSLSLVTYPESESCGWGCQINSDSGEYGGEEKQYDHRFYHYAGEIVAWILGISGLLIVSWITYQLSDTDGTPTISIEYIVPETSSRLLALISIRIIPIIGFLKSFLLLPHLIILSFLNLFALAMSWVGLICTLFGSYPESVRNIVLTCWMWNWRVAAYYICLSDTYPPFSDSVDYPTEIVFDEREGSSRSKLLTFYGSFLGGKFVLLLPRIFVLLFHTFIAGIAVFLGPIVVLVIGQYPESWMDYIIKTRTQWTQINAYMLCITEVLPPLYPGDYNDVSEKAPPSNRHYDMLMSQSMIGTSSPFEKRPSIQDNNLEDTVAAKEEQIMIECPGCNAKMKVSKLNKLQDVECNECGISGEIEI
jgi:hypothetical protein